MTSIVTISTGALIGSVDAGIRRFLGIPYAQPPFGDRRFALPEPALPWTGERDATAFGPTAPQDPYFGPLAELLGSVDIPGDDILTANVWAPASVPADGLPVMVWIHGGALERGSAALPLYDGSAFARDGVVQVSLNYRVGSEGFSVLEGAPRNLGLMDAAAGLAWVHREIAAFGGDPDRITLVGQSAGGAIAAALLMQPESAALVAGAVIQSAPLEAVSPERGGRVTAQLAERLGVPATADAFRSLTPRQLVDARREHAAGGNPLSGPPGFMLVMDAASLPVSAKDGLADVDIPIIIGNTADEYRLWFPPEALAAIGDAQLSAAGDALGIPAVALDAYRAAAPDASPGELFGQLASDLLIRRDSIRAADRRTAPTWVYEFAWPSPVRDLRAAHALELGFVFDVLDSVDSQRLTGADAPQERADEMHADWVRFIQTGDAGWEPYTRGRAVKEYAATTRIVSLPRADVLERLPG